MEGIGISKYNFYYDETEHSRKINIKTIEANNYYDNFTSVVIGWNSEKEKQISEKFNAFEDKYSYCKIDGEFKSTTLKQKHFINGFASMNKQTVALVDDFLSLFNDDVLVNITVASKIEYLVLQLFEGYENNNQYNLDSIKYSITKALLVYQPKEIIQGMFENTKEFLYSLRKFLNYRIKYNQKNKSLKIRETEKFQEILLILNEISKIKTIEWDYDISFYGLKKYLEENSINDFYLAIDKEGNGKTIEAANNIGFYCTNEVESKNSFGVRMADILAGLFSKLLKALHNALKYNSSDEYLKRKLIPEEWFLLRPDQLGVYHKLYFVILELNNCYYKIFSGIYSDDLLSLISLLRYMYKFKTVEEMRKIDRREHSEKFNEFTCSLIQDYFNKNM
ncbi:MAG: hypothetical protein HFJ98_06690 [Eubacterium sp.]|nr:hypothetical protein [Eubacterium sp.]